MTGPSELVGLTLPSIKSKFIHTAFEEQSNKRTRDQLYANSDNPQPPSPFPRFLLIESVNFFLFNSKSFGIDCRPAKISGKAILRLIIN